MAGLLYFFPGFSSTNTPEVASKVAACDLDSSIGDAARTGRINVCLCALGPTSAAGAVVSLVPQPGRERTEALAGYYAETQTWIRVPSKDYWLGWYKDRPPGPIDLERGRVRTDYKVKLQDGNEWSIMAIQPFAKRSAMPAMPFLCKMPENGSTWDWEPHPAYKKLIDTYEKLWGDNTLPINEFSDLAVDTLAVNYRLDRYAVMALRLMSSEDEMEIIRCGMDMPELQKWTDQKKMVAASASAASSTSFGDGATIPVTSQPLLMPTG